MIVGKLAAAELNLCPEAAKPLDGVVVLYGCDHRADSLRHLPEVNRRRVDLGQAVMVGVFQVVVDVGRLDKGFAGYTTEVEAIAPEFGFLFHKEGFRPQLGGTRGHRQSGGSSTKDTDVEIK
jgi:hypothetical protein